MRPGLDDFLKSAARWNGTHLGIAYELSWWGKTDYSPEGTWCWYIFVSSEEFYPGDWARLKLERQDRESFGSWHRHWSYENFPDLDAHGGWTFGEMTTYLARTGEEHQMVKVGCDYAHYWDRERGYPEGLALIERDVKRSIERLVEMFPKRRTRCAYCGKYGEREEFYQSENGLVHRHHEEKLRADNWPKWLPESVQ